MINGVILAGGLSKRMGTDKGLLKISGITMVEHLYNKLSPLCNNILVVTNRPEEYSEVTSRLSVHVLSDEIRQKGPFSGIHAALGITDAKYNIVLACDMPNTNPELFINASQEAMKQEYDLIIARTECGRYQPLHAIYHKKCRNTIEQLLLQNQFKASELVKHVNTKVLSFDENTETMFSNMNTLEDYERWVKI